MKKLASCLIALALLLCAAALAEAPARLDAQCRIEDGNLVIVIPVDDGDEDWGAGLPDDDSPVALLRDEHADGAFELVYGPVRDGEDAVYAYHYRGSACDAILRWDVSVAGGAVASFTEGPAKLAPPADALDARLCGEWASPEEYHIRARILPCEDGAWPAVIACDWPGDSFVVVGEARYDCSSDNLLYWGASRYPLPDGEDGRALVEELFAAEDSTDLRITAQLSFGETQSADNSGNFMLDDEDADALSWSDDRENFAPLARAGE